MMKHWTMIVFILDNEIFPTWTAVDSTNVHTQRELMQLLKDEGWSVEVSIPLR